MIEPFAMPVKEKRAKNSAQKKSDLWIAPQFSLKSAPKQQQWNLRPDALPPHSRLLDLADTALELWEYGLKSNRLKKRKAA